MHLHTATSLSSRGSMTASKIGLHQLAYQNLSSAWRPVGSAVLHLSPIAMPGANWNQVKTVPEAINVVLFELEPGKSAFVCSSS